MAWEGLFILKTYKELIAFLFYTSGFITRLLNREGIYGTQYEHVPLSPPVSPSKRETGRIKFKLSSEF